MIYNIEFQEVQEDVEKEKEIPTPQGQVIF